VRRWRRVGLTAAWLTLCSLVFMPANRVSDPVRAGTALAETPPKSVGHPVGARPDAVATAGGRVWVLSSAVGEIHVLDVVSGRLLARIDLGASAPGAAMAAAFGAVWVVKASTRSLIRLDAGTRHRHVDTATTLKMAGYPDRVAIGAQAVWVAARDPGGGPDSIVRVDPVTRAQRRVAVPSGTRHIAAGLGALWVTNARRRTLTRIDNNTLATRTIATGVAPDAIAIGARAVWITSGSQVVRINPDSGERRRVTLPEDASRIAIGHGSVWVLAGGGWTVIRIDPATLRVRDVTPTASGADALVPVGPHSLWVALWHRNAAQRITVGP
jgi:sugar lactone lactonase YvrE